jgi:hypothetical protein
MKRLVAKPAPLELHVATDDGVGSSRLRTSATMLRLRYRVYADAVAWAKLQPWDKYLCRVHAYGLVAPDAVFCLESAAVLLGLPIFGEPRDIHVFDARRTTSTRYGDVVVHTSRTGRQVVEGAGSLRMTDSLHTALDLARVLPPAFGLAVADTMAHSAGEDADVVTEFCARASADAGLKGQRRLRWVSARIDGLPESPGESVSRAVIEWLGYPTPGLQHQFQHEGFVDRADFFWREYRVIGESDGWGKYSGTPDEVREQLRTEKTREDRLRRHEGAFARWDWRDTMRADPLHRKLAATGLPVIAKRNNAGLATLRQHRRSLLPRESDERLGISAAREVSDTRAIQSP